jgi:hypothetical protein
LTLQPLSNSATPIDGTNWAVIKTPTNDYVIVQATFNITNDWFVTNATLQAEAGAAIQWSGGETVPGNPLQRQVSTMVSTNVTVTALLGSSSSSLNVWVIWANLTVKTSGTLDPDDKAPLLVNGNWPTPTTYNFPLRGGNNGLGGGIGLGPIDCFSNPDLNYAFTIGKMEAKAILQPTGIGTLLTTNWNMERKTLFIRWSNGGTPAKTSGDTIPPSLADDSSPLFSKIIIPIDGAIFDLDPVGSVYGTTIDYTTDKYGNYYEYVTVNLGSGDEVCSMTNTYSYMAQIDTNAIPEVQTNVLSTSLITPLPTNSIYTPR